MKNNPNKGRIKEKYIKQLRKSYSRESEKRIIDFVSDILNTICQIKNIKI